MGMLAFSFENEPYMSRGCYNFTLVKVMKRIFCFMLSAIMAMMGATAQSIYVCGTFNGWDPKNPVELSMDSDGIYVGIVNFSGGVEFKMSTVKGVTGNGWEEFDSGTLALASGITPSLATWLPIVGATKSANQQAPSQDVLTLRVNLEDMVMMYTDGAIADTPWSGTLPVLFVTTAGKQPITSKETYLSGTYYLDPMGVEGVAAIGSKDSQFALQIRGRGNYTWSGFNKKPYRVKFTDKVSILGMKKNRHFALLAHADDDLGFMRNTLGFAASRVLGLPWTPAQQPVELVINDNYLGLYFLTETIRVDKDRVNVVEQDDNATTEVDGGWLVEIDNYDSDPHVTIKENGGAAVWFTYKSPEILSVEQSDYLQGQMQAIDDAVYSQDKQNITPLANLVDINVLARYYIVQQLMCDEESFHGSCYLNRQRGTDEKWKFGPVWDFGNAYRNDRGTNPRFIFQQPAFSQVWIGEIYSYPAFVREVKRVWSDFLSAGGPSQLIDEIREMRDRISVAAIANERKWPEYGNGDIHQKSSRIIGYLENSVDWLKKQWGNAAGIEDVMPDADAPVTIYSLQGAILRQVSGCDNPYDGLTPGLYIVATGEGTRKILIR